MSVGTAWKGKDQESQEMLALPIAGAMTLVGRSPGSGMITSDVRVGGLGL